MGGDNRKGRERYRDFVVKGIAGKVENPFGEVKATAILSTEEFIGWVKEQFLAVREWPRKDYPHIKTLQKTIPVEEIANLIGPILVNNRACQAVQMVISNSPYSHKFPLIGESQSQEPMARTAMD